MESPTTDVVIIGAGLTGLTLAYLLRQSGKSVLLLEARDRIGGRVHTDYVDEVAPLELGATWLGRKHTALWDLLRELDLSVYSQRQTDRAIYESAGPGGHQLVRLPANDAPSYRIAGGSSRLIEALVARLQPDQLRLGRQVRRVTTELHCLIVETDVPALPARTVVSTVPPYLLDRTVAIAPPLPATLRGIAGRTHTWMGESIKVGLRYARPFWRERGLSGTVFSQAGPVTEMYDHADQADGLYALKGFVHPAWSDRSSEERRAAVVAQLMRYYGSIAADYLDYQEMSWAAEPLTYRPYLSSVAPHQYGGHPVYRNAYLDGRLYLAGSETADRFSGYMEGAVRSARYVYRQLQTAAAASY